MQSANVAKELDEQIKKANNVPDANKVSNVHNSTYMKPLLDMCFKMIAEKKKLGLPLDGPDKDRIAKIFKDELKNFRANAEKLAKEQPENLKEVNELNEILKIAEKELNNFLGEPKPSTSDFTESEFSTKIQNTLIVEPKIRIVTPTQRIAEIRKENGEPEVKDEIPNSFGRK